MDISKYNKYFKNYDKQEKYKLGKTYKYDLEKSYIKLYYDNKRMIFQTPALYIPYKPRKNTYTSNNNYTIDMSFFNEGIDKALPEYEKWFYNLEKTVYKLLRKRSYLRCNKSGFKTLFKGDDYRYTKKMSIGFNEKDTDFFQLENIGGISLGKSLDEISFPCYGFFILEVQTIWLKKSTNILTNNKNTPPNWGIKLAIHAIQCVPNHNNFNKFNKISFLPPGDTFSMPNNNTNITIPPPPPPPPPLIDNKPTVPKYLDKFFKMIKMGIPKDAVKHKMKMAGLSGDLLDNPHSNTSSNSNSSNLPSNIGGPVKITSDMLGSVSLKKTIRESPEERKKRISKEKAKSAGGMGFEINLDEILNIRGGLKKTGNDPTKKMEKEINKNIYVFK